MGGMDYVISVIETAVLLLDMLDRSTPVLTCLAVAARIRVEVAECALLIPSTQNTRWNFLPNEAEFIEISENEGLLSRRLGAVSLRQLLLISTFDNNPTKFLFSPHLEFTW